MFKSAKKTGIAVVGALALAACGTQLRKAEQVPVEGSAFDRHLYGGYIALAQSEFDEGDYRDSDGFAERAIRAARGEPVPPEAIEARRLPANRSTALAQARQRLVRALEAGARERAPERAARLQTAFDCWMQEQEESLESADIAACRSLFEEQIAALEAAPPASEAEARPVAKVPLPPAKKARQAEPAAVAKAPALPTKVSAEGLPGTYIIFFEFDEARLDDTAREILSEVVRAASEAKSLTIVASGHADRVGPSDYNESLARKRAEAVTSFLEQSGVQKPRIRSESFGERKPLVATSDEAQQLQNRRVEIRFLRDGETAGDANGS